MASASGTAAAGGVGTEIHTRMCKKIAQLTKVIYHLNIKNEDHEAEVARLVKKHEAALAAAAADAAERLARLSQEVQSNPEAERLRREWQ